MKLDPRLALSSAKFYSFFADKIISKNVHKRLAQEFINVQPGQRVLDIGCGPADILEFLPDVDYVGFDMSENYIRDASLKYGDRGQFICKALSPSVTAGLDKFDHVIAIGVLHHLSDAEAMVLINTAHSALKPAGQFFTFDGAYTDEQSATARWLLDNDRGNFVRMPEEYAALVRTKFPITKQRVLTDLLRIPYTHCLMTCTT